MESLFAALTPSQADWVRAAPITERVDFLATFASAARLVGRAPIHVRERGTWTTDEVARALLVVLAAPLGLTAELYDRGDNGERQAVLRALPYLEDAASHVALAVDACRTNVQTIFEAIACENSYPAKYFSDLAYNQMILKAVFIGAPLARVVGLAERRTHELARMANDFAAERRAAGRAVPADLELLFSKGAP